MPLLSHSRRDMRSRRSITRLLAVACAALGAVACGAGDGGAGVTPPTATLITGRFRLQSVDGALLPARLDSTNAGTLTVLGDTLVIEASGAYRGAARLVFRRTGALGQTTREPYSGTAVVAGPDSAALQGNSFVTGRARLVGGDFLIVRTSAGARVAGRALEYIRIAAPAR